MNIEEFDYNLPEGIVAQYPLCDRASSRLLVLNKKTNTMEHCHFSDIMKYLQNGDVLVLNDSEVFPARLVAKKDTGGAIDILLVERMGNNRWICLVRGVKRRVTQLVVSIGDIQAHIAKDGHSWIINFIYDGDDSDIIQKYGKVPLPSYIKRKRDDGIDFERYQTVYAETVGSIAAPTAGFHFTEELLNNIKMMGVEVVKLTLHIGIGTFLLVKTKHVEEHTMHREYYSVTPELKTYIHVAKREGRRIVACGTSVARTLETIESQNGNTPLSGYTGLFIYPGYTFKVVDSLITNFHLPRSTPLLLISAFAGKDSLLRCYREAIAQGYRFYSYGDAMFIV